jgi:hypothetical protein
MPGVLKIMPIRPHGAENIIPLPREALYFQIRGEKKGKNVFAIFS